MFTEECQKCHVEKIFAWENVELKWLKPNTYRRRDAADGIVLPTENHRACWDLLRGRARRQAGRHTRRGNRVWYRNRTLKPNRKCKNFGGTQWLKAEQPTTTPAKKRSTPVCCSNCDIIWNGKQSWAAALIVFLSVCDKCFEMCSGFCRNV